MCVCVCVYVCVGGRKILNSNMLNSALKIKPLSYPAHAEKLNICS